MGDASLISILGTISLVSALACLGMPLLTKHFKKRDLFIVLCAVECIARVGFYMSGYDSALVVLTWLAVVTTLNMMNNPIMAAMIADTVEYSYFHSGKRTAAITFSGQTFTGKLAVALSGGIMGLILAYIGYAPDAAVQSEATLNGLFFCVSFLPIFGHLVRIAIMSRYTFTEDQHAILREKLHRGEFAEGVTSSSATNK
ncbi:MAG: MFS transporter, partial [Psychromonas sp.]|nr:MFS transporter [Psychromonas sp.]